MARAAERPRIFTIGHSTRSASEFIAILTRFAIARVVDIRSIPGSAAHPQFKLETLESALRQAGIAYTHLALLGGRRPKSRLVDEQVNAGWQVRAFHNYADYAQGDDFQDGLRQLLELARHDSCAIMCAEVLWWRCHRRIVTDYLLAREIAVTHLFSETKSEPASLTPFAVIGVGKRVSYPASAGRELQAEAEAER
jgi:uncharacterized protein (DUF488 family)